MIRIQPTRSPTIPRILQKMIHLSQNGLFSVTEVIFKSTAEIEPVDLDMHQISGFPTDHSLALGD